MRRCADARGLHGGSYPPTRPTRTGERAGPAVISEDVRQRSSVSSPRTSTINIRSSPMEMTRRPGNIHERRPAAGSAVPSFGARSRSSKRSPKRSPTDRSPQLSTQGRRLGARHVYSPVPRRGGTTEVSARRNATGAPRPTPQGRRVHAASAVITGTPQNARLSLREAPGVDLGGLGRTEETPHHAHSVDAHRLMNGPLRLSSRGEAPTVVAGHR